MKGNATLNGLHGRYHIALIHLFVCEVVQVGIWLEADRMVSSP